MLRCDLLMSHLNILIIKYDNSKGCEEVCEDARRRTGSVTDNLSGLLIGDELRMALAAGWFDARESMLLTGAWRCVPSISGPPILSACIWSTHPISPPHAASGPSHPRPAPFSRPASRRGGWHRQRAGRCGLSHAGGTAQFTSVVRQHPSPDRWRSAVRGRLGAARHQRCALAT